MKANQLGVIHLIPLVVIVLVGMVVFTLIARNFSFNNGFLANLFPKDSSFAAIIAVPSNLIVEEGDLNAILSWNNYWTEGNNNFPSGAVGFAVYWGVYDTNSQTLVNPQVKLTGDKIIQLQPLTPGVTYGAYIRSVDNDGNTSAPSDLVQFKSDSTRVNTLRTQMNGFFDDFNTPAGAFNELKWNSAYSACIGPGLGAQFVNNQFHSHNQAFTSYCDRGQNISRPRGVFDFSSGVTRPNGDTEFGTIVFDMDGSIGRDTWYLDIYDIGNGILDIPPRAADDGAIAQAPANSLRIAAGSFGATVLQVDNKGFIKEAPRTPGFNKPSCCDPRLTTVKNVRNKWEIKVSQNRVIVKINGVVADDVSGLNLPFTKAYVNWAQFTYNTPKASMPTTLLHWDNFGWDASIDSVKTTVTHNYTNGVNGVTVASKCHTSNGLPAVVCTAQADKKSTLIKIPDSINGSTGQRLMFTIQSDFYGFSSNDHILVNGVRYNMPEIMSLPQNAPLGTPNRIIDGITPMSVTIPITAAQTGDNNVQFNFAGNIGILNIHMELDFPIDSAPNYTQPYTTWNYQVVPPLTAAGVAEIPNIAGFGSVVGKDKNGIPTTFQVWNFPGLELKANGNGQEPAAITPDCWWCPRQSIQMEPNEPIYQSGDVKLEFSSSGWVALAGLGSYPGNQSYQIYIDRQKVFEKLTNAVVPAPFLNSSYTWNTTNYCNGVHELFIVTFTPSGMASTIGYGDYHDLTPGHYQPIMVYTNNPGQPDCGQITTPVPSTFTATPNGSTPMPSSTPTPTPTAVPSATPVSTPGATPTATPGAKVGDMNGDGLINVIDLSYMLSKWNGSDSKADINGDGRVNVIDLSALLSRWGK